MDLTSFQETSLLEIMTAFITNFFLSIGIEISRQKPKPKEERPSQLLNKRDLIRTLDLFRVSLTTAGYVGVLEIFMSTEAGRIKVMEEKLAQSYLWNCVVDTELSLP